VALWWVLSQFKVVYFSGIIICIGGFMVVYLLDMGWIT